VGQPPDHCVARGALAATAATPLVRFDDGAGQYRPVRFEPLSHHGKAEAVESSEGGQIRAAEAGRRGSVRHVEVFRMVRVRTSILGRPRLLPGHRRAERSADERYTVICEEPPIHNYNAHLGTQTRTVWLHRLPNILNNYVDRQGLESSIVLLSRQYAACVPTLTSDEYRFVPQFSKAKDSGSPMQVVPKQIGEELSRLLAQLT